MLLDCYTFLGPEMIHGNANILMAKLHGNEPSKGAKIDAQIQAEEEEELRRKRKGMNFCIK
jgi:hypothetical protein